MGYRQRMKSPRASGRGYGTPRHEKAKARGRRHRSVRSSMLEENHVAAAEEVVDRTLKRLRTLGSQKFASSPYSEHFSRWQTDLAYVLSEFESSPTISTDNQFVKERSQILSNVELKLEERRHEETALEEAIKSLSDSKILLERIEEEYATKARELEGRKNSEIKRLNKKIDALRGELDEVARMKAGLFRAISKKAKAQKETETTQRLNTAQRELALAVQDFTAEQERLPDEYEGKKQPVIEQIRDHQKEIEHLETDGSLEDRRVACEALVNAVNALLQRKTSTLQ
jgi:DNA repair exonuclease SbcCD ATPase subunit